MVIRKPPACSKCTCSTIGGIPGTVLTMTPPYQHHRRLRCWLVAFAGSLSCWSASAADPLPQQVEHPFRNLAAWLREVSPDLRSADTKVISRGITVLSNSQSYVKSFDGMAYELKGKIKEGSSTNDITKLREQAELYESATSARKAAKLSKLLVEVEKALNAAEAAEIASQFDVRVTAQYMEDAGLRPLPVPPPPPVAAAGNASDSCIENATTVGSDETLANGCVSVSHGAGVVEGTRISLPSLDINTRSKHDGGVVGGRVGVGGNGGGGGGVGGTGKESNRSRRRRKSSPTRKSTEAEKNEGEEEDEEERRQDGDKTNKKKRRAVRDERREDMPKQTSGKRSSPSVERQGRIKRQDVGDPLEAFVARVPRGGEVQCLLMVDDRDKRLVLAVGDALSGEALLGCLIEEPAVVQLASHGLMRETAYVNQAAFQAACDILEWAGPHLKASLAEGANFEGYPVHCAGHSFGGAVAACLAGMLDGTIDVRAPREKKRIKTGGGGSPDARGKGPVAGSRIKAREESREQSRNPQGEARDRRMNGAPASASADGSDGEEETGIRVDGAAPWVGVCRDAVTCVTLGCPPCLSQNLRLPFVTSFVLGDDMVPRTSYESLRRLKIRLLQVMPKGKGLLSQGLAFSTSLFTDVAGVAMQGVRQATTSGENETRLTVPGRVWFAKPRRLKNGATLARVMKGNIKEDMLWQLHDVMLTKSMLSHHRLDKYIKILDRV